MPKVNDIWVCSWGYSMTLVDFYKVVKVSQTNVWLAKMDNIQVEGDCWSGRVVPNLEKVGKEVIRRKILDFGSGACCRISNYETAREWSGKPIYFNRMD